MKGQECSKNSKSTYFLITTYRNVSKRRIAVSGVRSNSDIPTNKVSLRVSILRQQVCLFLCNHGRDSCCSGTDDCNPRGGTIVFGESSAGQKRE